MPPAELTSYTLWCEGRGSTPYGNPPDPLSMRAALDQWELWELERQAWAVRHRFDELEMGDGCGQPWDPAAI